MTRIATHCSLALVLAVATLDSACRSSSTNVTGPSSSKCAVTLSGSTQVPAAGGTSTVGVSTNRECTWTAAAQAAWISVSPTSGQGIATLTITTLANPNPVARPGSVTVNEARIDLQQEAAACQFTVTPTSLPPTPGGGGELTFQVTTFSTCVWTPSTSAPWLTVQGDPRRTGSATVVVAVAPNTGAARTGTLTVGAASVTITQSAGAAACLYSVTASPSSFAPAGGSGTLSIVTSQPTCTWTASPNVAWLALAGPASGVGNAVVAFTVQANGGGARAGSIGVASESASITQAGTSSCAYTVTPSSRSVPASGGSEAFDVDTAAGCSWTAASNAPWLSITGGSSGTGAGRVTFTAAANQGDARTGTLAIAGSVVSVTQPATACTFSVVPGSAAFTASGGTASFTVTTSSGCGWTASSADSWITITGGASGTGAGIVSIAVAASGGAARASTLTIAGQPITITQAGTTCSYSLTPTSLSVNAQGGANSVVVTAPAGCQWTASSNDAWLSVVSASGSGDGTVQFSVGVNAGAARTGTLTIAGLTFTVSQAAAQTCTYAINPTTSAIGASATTIPVTLTTQAGCAWTVTSNASWLSVAGAASGTGSATVTINAEAHTGASARTGTVAIGGQVLTVTQAAASCSFTVAPLTLSPSSAGGPTSVTVTTTSGCGWAAASNAAWITITGGASGTGSGSVSLTIAANTDTQARSGTITVANQTVTVTQAAAACTYAVNPTSIDALAAGGQAFVDVTTGTGCAWTASTVDAWITQVAPTSGAGSARVSFTVGANTTGSARTGTLTIASPQGPVQQVRISQP